MIDNAMGTLRGLLHEPDEQSWQTIVECLLQWPSSAELYDVALPYCHDMIKQWPETLPRIATQAMYRIFMGLSLIHISEPTRLRRISYAVFCLKKKK